METKIYKIKLRVGDTVMVRSGRDKGKTGKITTVHPKLNKVTVDGINIVKRHLKPSRDNPKGSMIEKTQPIWVSKVGIVNTTGKKKTSRIGIKVDKDGKKTRVYKTTGKEIK